MSAAAVGDHATSGDSKGFLNRNHIPGGGMARARKKTAKKRSVSHKVTQHKPANDDGPTLAGRPLWQGNLRLSLVSCPIALYSATSRRSDVSFHLLNPKTNNR